MGWRAPPEMFGGPSLLGVRTMAESIISGNTRSGLAFPTNAWATPFVSEADATFILRTRDWARTTFDEIGQDPKRWLERLGQRGFFERALDRERGGIHVTFLSQVREAMAGVCGTADSLVAVQTLVAYTLLRSPAHGDMVNLLAGGRAMAAFALTEADAGSDILGTKTRAVRGVDGYRITGQKVLVSQGHSADFLLVFARTGESGPQALSAFLVPADRAGVRTRSLASLAPHPLSEVTLEDVHVPLGARIGPEGSGFRAALDALARVRPSVGAAAVGMAEAALGAALDRASSRMIFGSPLANNEAIRARLADAATDLEASRLLVYRAAWLIDQGAIEPRSCGAPGSMAKLFATERAQSIIDMALQVFGGHGILAGTLVERLYREVRALRLYEGTSEIQRVVIARELFDDVG